MDCAIVLRGLSDENGLWNTYWMRRRSSMLRCRVADASGVPSSATVPVKPRFRPAMHCDSVVLPEPDSPSNSTHSPRVTARSTPRSTS